MIPRLKKTMANKKDLRNITGMGPLTRTSKMIAQQEAIRWEVPQDYNKRLVTIKGLKERANFEKDRGFTRKLTPEQKAKLLFPEKLPSAGKSVRQKGRLPVMDYVDTSARIDEQLGLKRPIDAKIDEELKKGPKDRSVRPILIFDPYPKVGEAQNKKESRMLTPEEARDVDFKPIKNKKDTRSMSEIAADRDSTSMDVIRMKMGTTQEEFDEAKRKAPKLQGEKKTFFEKLFGKSKK